MKLFSELPASSYAKREARRRLEDGAAVPRAKKRTFGFWQEIYDQTKRARLSYQESAKRAAKSVWSAKGVAAALCVVIVCMLAGAALSVRSDSNKVYVVYKSVRRSVLGKTWQGAVQVLHIDGTDINATDLLEEEAAERIVHLARLHPRTVLMGEEE